MWVSLPTEVWQLIAARMDSKDWARASGICRASWEVQVEEICLGETVAEALALVEQQKNPASAPGPLACLGFLPKLFWT